MVVWILWIARVFVHNSTRKDVSKTLVEKRLSAARVETIILTAT